MTREETIRTMIDKANKLTKHYSYDLWSEIWGICSDWNSEHYNDGEEIFMCEYQSDDSEYVNGFMIEDDWWVFNC